LLNNHAAERPEIPLPITAMLSGTDRERLLKFMAGLF
jgi:hypothetical protein